MEVPWFKDTSTTPSNTLGRTCIPGILSIDWVPTVGYSATATDPASIVGKEIFAKVRETFGGSIDADAPDFVIYLMALDSIFAYIAYMKRIYRILGSYTSENHYLPDAFMTALGFTAAQITELKQDRMQFYQITNELVFMTRKFNIPAVFDIMNRHYWMSDNVYMDANTINSQFYIFNPQAFYKYGLSTSGSVQVGSLSVQPVNWTAAPSGQVVDTMFQFGRDLIDALAGSDDAHIISGYLMKAYQGVPVFGVDELPLDDRLVPVYSEEVLAQIENAMPLPFASGNGATRISGNAVSQNPTTNAILCAPKAEFTGRNGAAFKLTTLKPHLENFLSIRSDNPSVADVTIATRLKMGWENMIYTPAAEATGTSTITYDVVCGSEIVLGMTIWANSYAAYGLTLLTIPLPGVSLINDGAVPSITAGPAQMLLQSFDWHPILPVIGFTTNATPQYANVAIAGDCHNMTLLTNEALKQLNRVCLYSEFNAYGQL